MKIFERMSSYESIDVPKFCMVFPLKSKGMTSRWPLWYHFWRENLARSHSDDISSEIVLISHCLYRMNVRGAVLNEILHYVNVRR